MKYKAGDLFRSKQKRSVPVDFRNKHFVIIDGPKQIVNQHSGYFLNPVLTHRTIYTIYVVEDCKYRDVEIGFIHDFMKLEVRPLLSDK